MNENISKTEPLFLKGKVMNLRFIAYKVVKLFTGRKRALVFYMKKYLKPVEKFVDKEFEQIPPEQRDIMSDKVWTMWLQDDVPEIIQLCLDSIKKFYPDTIIITEKNIFDYVEIPDYIWKKYKNGIISAPHFSDYVRCVLLDKFGGTWIDASCYMLSPVPAFIQKQKFFILQEANQDNISNFFIRAAKNNYLIKTMRKFLEEYWKKEIITIDYFFFHAAFMMFVTLNSKCKDIWKNIIPGINSKVRFFVKKMFLNFDSDLWDYLKSTCFMYKLNRKSKRGIRNKNSWYWYFINMYRKENSSVKEEK